MSFIAASKKIDPIFDKLSMIVFFFIIGIAIYQDINLIPEYIRFAGIKTVLIFILAFIMSVYLTKLFKLIRRDSVTIIVETVLQNGGVGIVLGAIMFDNVKFIFPVAAYALLQYFVLAFYVANIKIVK